MSAKVTWTTGSHEITVNLDPKITLKLREPIGIDCENLDLIEEALTAHFGTDGWENLGWAIQSEPALGGQESCGLDIKVYTPTIKGEMP